MHFFIKLNFSLKYHRRRFSLLVFSAVINHHPTALVNSDLTAVFLEGIQVVVRLTSDHLPLSGILFYTLKNPSGRDSPAAGAAAIISCVIADSI